MTAKVKGRTTVLGPEAVRKACAARCTQSLPFAGAALGISRAQVYRLADAGIIETLRLGGRRVVLSTYLASLLGLETPDDSTE